MQKYITIKKKDMDPFMISALGSLAGNFMTNQSVNRQNEESMRFQAAMYEEQNRRNIEFWRMQNEYNHPKAQKERLIEAGLNPALVYGGVGASAAGIADTIKTSEIGQPMFQPQNYDFNAAGSFIMQMYDLEKKDAEISNLRAQNTVLANEALLKLEQIGQTSAQTKRALFDLDFESELREVSAEARRLALRQTAENIKVMKSTQRLNDAQIQYIKSNTTLNKLEIDLQKLGLNRNSPIYHRILGRAINDEGFAKETINKLRRYASNALNVKSALSNTKDFFTNLFK